MADPKLTHILRLSQELKYQFNDVNHRISEAWLKFESAQATLNVLMLCYEEWQMTLDPLEGKDSEQQD